MFEMEFCIKREIETILNIKDKQVHYPKLLKLKILHYLCLDNEYKMY